MEIGYIGGIVRRGDLELPTRPGWERWHWTGEGSEAFLLAGGPGCRLFARGPLVVLIRGFVRDTWSQAPADLERLADRIAYSYRDRDLLHIDGLEGSFTLALVDGTAGRLLLYRNLVGDSHTYYHESCAGLLFASNLADLIEAGGTTPQANEDELPTYFLNRNVPGRNTLFAGYHRVLPGEQLAREDGRLSRLQRRTIGDLYEEQPIDREAPERLEATIAQICSDFQAEEPATANLLSGGVDSSFLQAHWNRVLPAGSPRPPSWCVAVDHPRTRGDREYAETAAQLFRTRHTIVPTNNAYADYLQETMTTTAEMPSHVQLAYFLTLGREMSAHGLKGAMLGEGADSLFGLGVATAMQSAALVRKLFPAALLRRGGAKLAGWLGLPRVRGYFQLAEYLNDYERLDHPVNRVAVYADWPAVEACFGKEAVAEVAASRRALLDQHRVGDSPLERVHYAGVLGSSINISALVTTLFARTGVRVFSPFYDSRMLRLAVNLSPRQRFQFRRPKGLLKDSLIRHGFRELAERSKKSFGQPIFEWLAPGGQLAPLVEQMETYPFIEDGAVAAMRAKPTWFLFSLLCYDLWRKQFIHPALAPVAA